MIPPIDINAVKQLSIDAGHAILAIYQTDFSITKKSDHSPLTQADMASHHIIVAGLADLTPDIPVLSEESVKIPFSTRSQWQTYWLIDPLDGTKEFIKRNGEFTVNIALIHQGVPMLGVIYVPVTATLYSGEQHAGAFKQLAQQSPTPIHVRTQLQDPIQVAGSRSHAGDSLQQFLHRLGSYDMISMGSSLKFCLVAEGITDIYPRLGLTCEWDTAAAQAIVTAAGGQVTTLDRQPLMYNTKDSLLNPHFLVFGAQAVNWSQYLDTHDKH